MAPSAARRPHRRGEEAAAAAAAGLWAKRAAAVLAIALALFHGADRHLTGGDTCAGLLNDGRFLGDEVWQPRGCMMHTYRTSEISDCLRSKQVTFVGDSRVRQLFYAFTKLINPQRRDEGKKHTNITFEEKLIKLKVNFFWYPEINSSVNNLFKAWNEDRLPRPDMTVIAAGTWSIKLNNGSEEALTQYKINITALLPHMKQLAADSPVYWVLQDPVNEAILSERRRMITNVRIDSYNEAVLNMFGSSGTNSGSGGKLLVLKASQLIAQAGLDKCSDGLHLPESVLTTDAMILLNALCNPVIQPVDGSCCLPQPRTTLVQQVVACVFVLCAFLSVVLRTCHRPRRASVRPSTDEESGEEKKLPVISPLSPSLSLETVVWPVAKLGLIMAYFYLCDRANLFMKEQKHYSHTYFFVPVIYVMVLGIFYSDTAKDSSMLNREQTNEWKGWMQLVILIYHISGASAFLPVYMHVRVLVAAYLFLTGYGHFYYFWSKGDLGLHRLLQVCFRLNFLVVILCLVMDRPYQFYYFVPLVTVWFIVMFLLLSIWPQISAKISNGSVFFYVILILKFCGLVTCIVLLSASKDFFEKMFSFWPLSELFELNGNLNEWWFRWQLDRFSVVQGMLFGFGYLTLRRLQLLGDSYGDGLLPPRLSLTLLILAIASLTGFSVWASKCKNKTECNKAHPFISVVPILAFIFIRNLPGCLRHKYSTFFAWFGKLSLELFICQCHIWLAADTKGILVLIPGIPFLNLTVTTFIFTCAAHEIFEITNTLSHVLIPKEGGVLFKKLLCVGAVLLVLLLLHWIHQRLPV
ncbi:N-acetylneuraminate (7)9-O-acetyltransferase isoform X1 [Lampetra fluviatilis]